MLPENPVTQLRREGGWIRLAHLGLLKIGGPQRVKFLHNLLSNDISGLAAGHSRLAALMNLKGQQVAWMRVLAESDALICELPVEVRQTVLDTFAHYKVGTPVRFELLSGVVYGVFGPKAPQALKALGFEDAPSAKETFATIVRADGKLRATRASDMPAEGFTVHVEESLVEAVEDSLLRELGDPMSAQTLDTLRVEEGLPWHGIDVKEENLLHETGRLGIYHSSSKGCYLGQEVVARLEGRGGNVNKRFRGFKGSLVFTPGAEILADDKVIGRVTTSGDSPEFGAIGMGYVHRSHGEPGAIVKVGGNDVEVVRAAFPRVMASAIARKLKWTLFGAQAMGSAGFLVASTVTPIVGAQLSGRPSFAGVPSAFYWAGGALATLLWGRLMDPLGRRITLTLGLLIGVVGALVASAFVIQASFPGFVLGLVMMGAANSALQLARFMAGEVHPTLERGRAISTVVLGGTVGAVLGPTLVAPMSALSDSFGAPPLAGPYAASAAFFVVGAILVTVFLRPDPRDLAREIHEASIAPETRVRSIGEILRVRDVQLAGLTLAIGQLVMVMLMVITSLHMAHHDHALSSIAAVMSSHVFGMYAFSIVSGRLADFWGRGALIGLGAMVLVIACLTATISTDVGPLAFALFLLGLGWNFCYVGGSTLLSDSLSHHERARIQSVNDFILTTLAGTGSALSGLVFSSLGYAMMGYVSAAFSLALVFLSFGVRRRVT